MIGLKDPKSAKAILAFDPAAAMAESLWSESSSKRSLLEEGTLSMPFFLTSSTHTQGSAHAQKRRVYLSGL